MTAYEAATGKPLWTSGHERGGYESPRTCSSSTDWCGPPLTSGRDSGVWTGRDLRTGETKRTFPPKVNPYWFHHRCYIAKATEKYLLASRTGIEFVDYEKASWSVNHWVRGGCLYGIMPANGLVYAPPHNCACYPEAKLYGLNALAPARKSGARSAKPTTRLEKGPAYGKTLPSAEASDADWPTYRGSPDRSGKAKAPVSRRAGPCLRRPPSAKKARLSAVTVAEGKLFVAEIDAHAVHALDAANGKILWSRVAGGRVDSPPTYHQGAVLFGSVDGTVTALRASDGALAWRFLAAPEDLRHFAFEHSNPSGPSREASSSVKAPPTSWRAFQLPRWRPPLLQAERLYGRSARPKGHRRNRPRIRHRRQPSGPPPNTQYARRTRRYPLLRRRLRLHALPEVRPRRQPHRPWPPLGQPRRPRLRPTRRRRPPLLPYRLSGRGLLPPQLLGVRAQLRGRPRRLLPSRQIRSLRPPARARRGESLRLRPQAPVPQVDHHTRAPALLRTHGATRRPAPPLPGHQPARPPPRLQHGDLRHAPPSTPREKPSP